eukprot:1192640-Prorocentrum_minimum.AAC.1
MSVAGGLKSILLNSWMDNRPFSCVSKHLRLALYQQLLLAPPGGLLVPAYGPHAELARQVALRRGQRRLRRRPQTPLLLAQRPHLAKREPITRGQGTYTRSGSQSCEGRGQRAHLSGECLLEPPKRLPVSCAHPRLGGLRVLQTQHNHRLVFSVRRALAVLSVATLGSPQSRSGAPVGPCPRMIGSRPGYMLPALA